MQYLVHKIQNYWLNKKKTEHATDNIKMNELFRIEYSSEIKKIIPNFSLKSILH